MSAFPGSGRPGYDIVTGRNSVRSFHIQVKLRGEEPTMHNFFHRDAILFVLLALAVSMATSIQLGSAEQLPDAISGYDPVTYFSVGEPTPGLQEIEYDWNGYLYRLSSADNRERFKADPVRYAPQFGNFCAMALSRGKIVVADPRNWLISDGKLYIFGKPEGSQLFQQDLAGNIARANQNRSLLPRP